MFVQKVALKKKNTAGSWFRRKDCNKEQCQYPIMSFEKPHIVAEESSQGTFTDDEISSNTTEDTIYNNSPASRNRSDSGATATAAAAAAVNFSTVEIRAYEITLGDNPGCMSGPPISIEWESFCTRIVDLDLFEKHRIRSRRQRGSDELRIDKTTRERMLMQTGKYSSNDLTKSAKEAELIRESRLKCIDQLKQPSLIRKIIRLCREQH